MINEQSTGQPPKLVAVEMRRRRAVELWPLFELEIRTPRLVLAVPTDDEIGALAAYAREGVHPPGERPFIRDWTSRPSPAFERGFAQYLWGLRARWSVNDWALPLAVFTREGEPVGVQQISGRDYPVRRCLRSGTWIGLSSQGRGFGTEAREAALELGFRYLGARSADAGTNTTNAGAQRMLQKLGYRWNGVGETVNGAERVLTPIVNFRLDAETWLATSRSHIEVEGLERALPLFGIDQVA